MGLLVTQTETPTETSTEEQTAPAQVEVQTETPPEVIEESAAETPSEAAVPQVAVVEEKPEYVTREQWEREKAEVAQRAASEAIEADRRRRQTENARKAQNEERQRLRVAQTVDTVKATLIARGIDPEAVTEEAVVTAIDRVAQERADAIARDRADSVGEAWDYLTAPAYGQNVELDDSFADAARVLSPKLQHFIDQIRPQIEAKAREGYVAESDLPKRVDAEIARRAAQSREGVTELARPEGSPASSDEQTWWSSLTPEGRRDPANIARYDRYTARR